MTINGLLEENSINDEVFYWTNALNCPDIQSISQWSEWLELAGGQIWGPGKVRHVHRCPE
ncbi:MAG: hypothetical protein DHS20C17_01370 [Cyclobacteriaceae bacterium]|nr:MAG: hypothetical protein DHS20C17_01370 [Cyclobacteriaceae bacterium]